MAALPPNPLSSILQIAGAQQAAGERRARQIGEHSARQAHTDAIRDVGNIIHESDQDTAVFTDAETGGGSQGRSLGGSDANTTNDAQNEGDHQPPSETGGFDARA